MSRFHVGDLVESLGGPSSSIVGAIGRVREIFPSTGELVGEENPRHIYVDWEPEVAHPYFNSISWAPAWLAARDDGYPR